MKNFIQNKIYSISPIFLQNIACSLYGYRERRLRFSKFYNKKFKFLSQSEWWSHDKIQDYKNIKVLEILKHAYNTTEFYRKTIDEHGYNISSFQNIEDIKRLPILTKEDIRFNLEKLLTNRIKQYRTIKCNTSGTSGKSLNFLSTKESIQFQWAVWLRFRKRFGVDLYDKSCNFTGKPVVPIGQSKPPFWRINKPINQSLINMQHINQKNLKSIVSFLNDSKFIFYSGYPSIINGLADLIQDSKYKIISHPKYIFTGAEKLHDDQRQRIENVFKCPVTDQYGTSEGVINASRCKNDVFHEDFEFGHIEMINKVKLSNGLFRGDLVGTGFSNFAMPFIRYKIGDSIVYDEKECTCKRSSFNFKFIDGRIEDYVLTPEGSKIMRFDYLFKNQTNIKECQVVQNKLGEIIYRMVKRENFGVEDEKKLIQKTREWISPSIKIKIVFTNEIKRTRSGKFRGVISNI